MHPFAKHFTLLLYCFILCTFLQFIQAIHEDQVGLHDWSLQFIGRPVEIFISSRPSSGSKPLAYTFTDQNVLAAVDLKHGEITWREVFERNPNRTILSAFLGDEEICVILGQGRLLRCFDQASGVFRWERMLGGKDMENTVCSTQENAMDDHSHDARGKSLPMWIVCVASDRTIALNTKTGGTIWESKETKCQRRLVYSRLDGLFTVCLNDNKIVVKRTGGNVWSGKESSVDKPAIVNPSVSRCDLIQPASQAAHFLVCVDRSAQTVFSFSTVASDRPQQLFSFEELGMAAPRDEEVTFRQYYADGLFGLFAAEQTHLMQLSIDGKVSAVKKLPGTVVAGCSSKELVSASVEDGTVTVRSAAVTGRNVFEFTDVLSAPYPASFGDLLQLRSIPARDDCSKVSFLFWTDGDVLGLASQGKIAWKREEGLASLNVTAVVDLPVSDIEALVEEEFEEKGSMPVRFLKRLVSQGLQLKKLTQLSINRVLSGLRIGKFFQKERLERDYFNTHKILLGVSDRGKIFGLDSRNGDVIYSVLIKGFAKPENRKIAFYLQRAGAHAPFASQAVVIGVDEMTGNGLLYFFDCITGEELQKPLRLERPILQTGLIPVMTSNHLEAIFVLDADLRVEVHPNLNVPEVKDFMTKSLYLVDVDTKSGVMRGFRVKSTDQGFRAKEIWTNALTTAGENVITVTPKRMHDTVYSQGRVLADRRVLYKYINPNLISVIVQGTDEAKKPYVKVLGVDGTTGRTVMSIIHRRARGPCHVVHSENWIMYSYWNEKVRSSELGVVELYRGFDKMNTTYFSSIESSEKPEISAAAFKLPGIVDAASDTVTVEGITHKNLIIALSSGSILQMPKVLLDPRRPMFPTQAEREEGLIPYSPELPYMTENVINYYKKTHNIRGIQTGSAGLESISLVFAFGLDLFFTRVMPSATFDVLSDNFDYWILSVVMLVMTVASVIVRNLANAKALKLAWK